MDQYNEEWIDLVPQQQKEAYNTNPPWATFDQSEFSEFFPDGSRWLPAISSENGEYYAAYETGGGAQPGGICLTCNHDVQYATPIGSIESAVPANDGTVVAQHNNAENLYVLSSSGDILLHDQFNSLIGPVVITPDGQYVATSTAHPDNAVHLYDLERDQYLGRKENTGSTVIGGLEFRKSDKGYMIITYDVHPESTIADDVARERIEPMNKFLVER